VPIRFGVVDLLAHGHTPESMSAHWPTSSLPMQPPNELGSRVVLMTMPDGLPLAGFVVCYKGLIEIGERVLRPLRSPLADEIGPSPYTVAQQLVDAFYPPDLQECWKPNFLTEISDATIDTMLVWSANRPSPLCHVVIEHTLGGAVSRIDRSQSSHGESPDASHGGTLEEISSNQRPAEDRLRSSAKR
jgi:hypothetical protein